MKSQNTKSKRNKKEVTRSLCEKSLTCQKTIEKKIEGWVGKAKGSLQILYKHGWIDEERLGEYTISGKKTNMVY
jgi:hypothetical protein